MSMALLWIPLALLGVYLTLYVLYQTVLFAANALIPEPPAYQPARTRRFNIVIPAHNEELHLPRLLDSATAQEYPPDRFQVTVIADNCTDGTVTVCGGRDVTLLERQDPTRRSKGYAIGWALERMPLDKFDAIVIVDGDSRIATDFLRHLNLQMDRGDRVIQCYNGVGNPARSWFTRVMDVSRTIANDILHPAKRKLGLSSHLMGNGMCFDVRVLRTHSWNAFSVGEDWEHYARLVTSGVTVGYSRHARVYHEESVNLHQASSQRLRWSGGRFEVLQRYGPALLWVGLRNRDLKCLDAALPLIFPNPSLGINLTLLGLFAAVAGAWFDGSWAMPVWFAVLALGTGRDVSHWRHAHTGEGSQRSLVGPGTALSRVEARDRCPLAPGDGKRRMEADTSTRFLVHTSSMPATVTGRMINVLFLTIDIRIGGAERLVLELVKQMDRSRFAPSVGWFVDQPAPKEFRELGIPLFPIQKAAGFDLQAMRKLARVVRENRIDVINAHHFMSFVYAIHATRLAQHAGLVYTEHSEDDVLRARGVWRPLGAMLLRSCDAIVGVSEGVSAALTSYFRLGNGRARTIENGVDLTRFGNAGPSRAEVRKRLNLASGDIVIGQVANFRANKNHLFMLKAFQRAFAGRTDVKLLLIGQGFDGDPENSEPAISAFVRDHGLEHVVKVMGYRPDVHEVLRAFDVFGLVSYREGLPLSVIEAMATGLPVVATDIDGLRGIVQPGINGVLVTPDDVEALARALNQLVADAALRERLGDAGRQLARDRYSFNRCLTQTQDLLAGTAGKRALGHAH